MFQWTLSLCSTSNTLQCPAEGTAIGHLAAFIWPYNTHANVQRALSASWDLVHNIHTYFHFDSLKCEMLRRKRKSILAKISQVGCLPSTQTAEQGSGFSCNQFFAIFRHEAWNKLHNYCNNPIPKSQRGKWFQPISSGNIHLEDSFLRPPLFPCAWLCRGGSPQKGWDQLWAAVPLTVCRKTVDHSQEQLENRGTRRWERVGTKVPRRGITPELGCWGIHLGLLDRGKAVGSTSTAEASCLVCLLSAFIQLISLKNIPYRVLA